jgi:hypothetical protein
MSTLTSYTSATRPDASSNAGLCIFRSDTEAIEVSDGSVWLAYNNDGATSVSGVSNAYSVLTDGSNDYVALGNVAALNSATNFAMSFYVNFQSFVANGSGYNIFVASGTGSANRFIINAIRATSSTCNNMEVYYLDSGTASMTAGSLGLSSNTWYHMALYKSGNNMDFYIDNVLKMSRTNAGTDSAAGSNLRVGSDSLYGTAYASNILIDEFAVWPTDETSNRTTIYNNGVPADLSNLGGTSGNGPDVWLRMGDNDSGTGTTVTNQGQSSTTNNGTLTNGASFSTTVPQ